MDCSVLKRIASVFFAFGTFAFVLVLRPCFAGAAGDAAFFLEPASGTFFVGSTFDLSVVLDTKEQAVNTVEVELKFSSDKLQLASPSVGKSIIELWSAPPVFSNAEGKIYFVGGIPSPGITTSRGVVLTLSFRVIAPGSAQISFGDRTSILLNDGRGTNVLGQHPPSFFTLVLQPSVGPLVTSPTHPDQERWYHDSNPMFVWQKGSFADGYSLTIDRDPGGVPDTVVKGAESQASFQNLGSGIWYFHLRERRGGVWGGVSHYVVHIDTDPPASFNVNVSPGLRTTNKNPIFRFFTTDALSGFDHFEMKIIPLSGGETGETLFFEVSSPYQATNIGTGRYEAIVRAIDRAGNTRDESVSLNIINSFTQFVTPEGIDLVFVFLLWPQVILGIGLIVLLLLLILLMLWVRHRHHLQHAFREDMQRAFHFFSQQKPPLSPMIFLLLFGLVFFMQLPSVADAVGLPVPAISVAPSVYYPLDEALYLKGNALPHGSVELLFEHIAGGVQPVRIRSDANINGEWFYFGRLELASGEWTVRARTLGDPPSDWSNPRIIRSVVSGFIVGGVTIKYVPVAMFLFILFLSGITLLVYAFIRVRTVRRIAVEREIKAKTEALEEALKEKDRQIFASRIEENFSDIRKKIMEELEHLEIKRGEGKLLSGEEEGHRAQLLAKLREAEEEIEKKAKYIS